MKQTITITVLMQIVQSFWWLGQTLIFQIPNVLYFQILTCLILFLKIAELYFLYKLKSKLSFKYYLAAYIFTQALLLEVNFDNSLQNRWTDQTNAITLIINQHNLNYYLQNDSQRIWHIFFPIYCIIRFLVCSFLNENYFLIETLIVISFFIKINLSLDPHESQDRSIQFPTQNDQEQSKGVNQQQEAEIIPSKGEEFRKYRTQIPDQIELELESSIRFSNRIFKLPNLSKQKSAEAKLNRRASYVAPNIQKKKTAGFQTFVSSITIHENQSESINIFFKSLLNLFPQGICIINQKKVITYMNSKIEKILECQGYDSILKEINTGISNSQIQTFDDNFIKTSKHNRQGGAQSYIEDLIRQSKENQQEVDFIDALLLPNKMQNQYSVSPNNSSGSLQKNNGEISIAASGSDSQIIRLNFTIKSKVNNQNKQLKLIIIQSQLSPYQQDQFSSSSNKLLSNIQNFQNHAHETQPILLIMIRNVTFKHDLKKLQNEMHFQSSLLKSFSHELRTPLNCSIQMLSIAKDLLECTTFSSITLCINQALGSNFMLLYQMNDILDYAAMQCETFQYQWRIVMIGDIVKEIELLYKEACESKSVKLILRYEESLFTYKLRTDRGRIMQVMVNLMNNALKFTKEGGEIQIKLRIDRENSSRIKIQVKDNGIGIQENKLKNIQKMVESTSGTLKSRKRRSFERGMPGLGITISSRIVGGLINEHDGRLLIKSQSEKGTKVSFYIEHAVSNQDIQVSNPMMTEPTNRTNKVFNVSNTFRSRYSQHFENDQSFNSVELESIGLRQRFNESPRQAYFKETASQQQQIKVENVKYYKAEDIREDSQETPSLNQKIPETFQLFFERHQSKNTFRGQQQSSLTPTVMDLGAQHSSQFYSVKKLCPTCVNVLIVDDVPFNQIALKAMMNHFNMSVDQAYDGYQALDCVRKKLNSEHCRSYKLILMDIEMPGMDGFQTTREILKVTKPAQQEPYIIMCSAYDTIENFEEGKKVGMVNFLPKPVKKKDLEIMLRKYVGVTN